MAHSARKIFMYTEYPLVGLLARKLGRPVKWIESREEHAIATAQGRDHVTDISVAATRDGKITGLRVKTWANMGAYLSTAAGGIPTTLYGRMVAGVYKIPNIDCRVIGTYTNTAMVDAYRGAGRPEAAYVIERAVDLVAGELEHGPGRGAPKELHSEEEFPFDTGIGMLPYDTGNYPIALDRALEMIGLRRSSRQTEGGARNGQTSWCGFLVLR